MKDLTAKQRKTLVRVLIAIQCFVVLMTIDRIWKLEELFPAPVIFVMYALPYLLAGYDVILRAFKNIRNGQVFDENFLMMIATFAAFAISEYSEALAVMLFYQVGELFQGYAVGRSRKSIADMMSIAPEYANLEGDDGSYEEVDPDDVEVGATIIIKPGEKIPLDGTVISGESYLNTAALTGESVPRRAAEGDDVISGCVNGEGTLRVRVSKAYEDSTVARILEMVENASSRKAKLEGFITRFAKVYTPVVTIGALLLAVVPPLVLMATGADYAFGEWIKRACIFLIVSCPCALVISVPLGFFGGIGAASGIGVLVKGGNFLEAIAEADTIVMDKTGTLTKGEFAVKKIYPAEGASAEELLTVAAAGESFSTHPIAVSIMSAYEQFGGQAAWGDRLKDVKEEAGHGVSCIFDGKEVYIGREGFLADKGIDVEKIDDAGTVVYIAADGTYMGSILIADAVKDKAGAAVSDMRAAGVKRLIMLTGDRKEAAAAVAKELGLDEYYAGLLPADKVSRVEELMNSLGEKEKLAFVGDGINDAPVLMRADVGIAMGSMGSDAAIEAADIVLMDDDIAKIADTVKIGRKTIRIVRENIVFAIGVKVIILILGAIGFASMWAAVFADVGVAVIAILNSMRCLKK
ncbi:MAG: cadmium-translocating P-type ATPase [Lachnospiraceae bacterium]|nr:cadmium-translocating P-type ATPase [Lachnospiraceae bacterium]